MLFGRIREKRLGIGAVLDDLLTDREFEFALMESRGVFVIPSHERVKKLAPCLHHDDARRLTGGRPCADPRSLSFGSLRRFLDSRGLSERTRRQALQSHHVVLECLVLRLRLGHPAALFLLPQTELRRLPNQSANQPHHFGVGDNLSESEGAGPPDFE